MCKINVPAYATEEITTGEFIRRAQNLFPETDPKFKLRDVVLFSEYGNVERKTPGVVIGFEPRVGGWSYTLVVAETGKTGMCRKDHAPEDRVELYVPPKSKKEA